MKKRILYLLITALTIFSINVFAQTYNELIKKAELNLKEKKYKDAAECYEKAFKVGDATNDFLYNAACCWALTGNKEKALSNLNKAVEKGWLDVNWMMKDPDLASLHKEKEWADLVSNLQTKADESKKEFNELLVKLDTWIEKVKKDTFETLKEELNIIFWKDQLCRQMMDSIGRKYGWQSNEMRELWKRQHVLDSTDLSRIEEIIAEHGYPGKTLVGDTAKETAFLVIQHAKLEIQEKYLPIIKEAALKGEVSGGALALLTDRILIRKGQKQIYGSQVRGTEFYPIEDEANVNKRRAEVGLPPLEEYAKHFNINYIPKTEENE